MATRGTARGGGLHTLSAGPSVAPPTLPVVNGSSKAAGGAAGAAGGGDALNSFRLQATNVLTATPSRRKRHPDFQPSVSPHWKERPPPPLRARLEARAAALAGSAASATSTSTSTIYLSTPRPLSGPRLTSLIVSCLEYILRHASPTIDFATAASSFFTEQFGTGDAAADILAGVAAGCAHPTRGLVWLFGAALGVGAHGGDVREWYDASFGAALLETLSAVTRAFSGDRGGSSSSSHGGLAVALFQGGGIPLASAVSGDDYPSSPGRKMQASMALNIAADLLNSSCAFAMSHMDGFFDAYGAIPSASAPASSSSASSSPPRGAAAGAGGGGMGWSGAGRLDLLRAVVACAGGRQMSSAEEGTGVGGGETTEKKGGNRSDASDLYSPLPSSSLSSSSASHEAMALLEAPELKRLFTRSSGPQVDVEIVLVGFMQAWLVESARVRRSLASFADAAAAGNEAPIRRALRSYLDTTLTPTIVHAIRASRDDPDVPLTDLVGDVLACSEGLVRAADAVHPDTVLVQRLVVAITPEIVKDMAEACCGTVYKASKEMREAQAAMRMAIAHRDEAEAAAAEASRIAADAMLARDEAESRCAAYAEELVALRKRIAAFKMDVATRSLDADAMMAEEQEAQARKGRGGREEAEEEGVVVGVLPAVSSPRPLSPPPSSPRVSKAAAETVEPVKMVVVDGGKKKGDAVAVAAAAPPPPPAPAAKQGKGEACCSIM